MSKCVVLEAAALRCCDTLLSNDVLPTDGSGYRG